MGKLGVGSVSCSTHGLLYAQPDVRPGDKIESTRILHMVDGMPEPKVGEEIRCPFCGEPLWTRIVY